MQKILRDFPSILFLSLLLLSLILIKLDMHLRIERSYLLTPFTPVYLCTRYMKENVYALIDYVKNVKDLSKENAFLKEKIRELLLSTSYKRELELENERLKALLNYKMSSGRDFIMAKVISQALNGEFHTIMVDRGSKEGVKYGMAVIAYQDGREGLVGKVWDVGEKTSLVLLITDKNSFVGVQFQESRRWALMQGEGGRCKIAHILLEEIPKKGEVVITSGGALYPKGIPVGYVDSVQKCEHTPFCQLSITPFIDFKRLDEVLLLK